jgi:two-component SAPR family response regulator
LLFGASLMVPALVATGLLLAREARTQSEQLDRRVEQVAGDLAHDIDRELELMTATPIVLAGAPQLADMSIVFCTAYAEEAGLAEQMLAVRHAALIPKPVSRAKLEQAFTQLFAGG